MKYLLSAILASSIAFGANADDKVVNPDSTGFKFTDVKTVKTTPVRDQNSSGTCWCFSTNSFLEEDMIKRGSKPVDLSEMFVVRYCYLDKARKYIRMDGKINFAQGGAAHDVPYVIETYGIVPEEVYQGLNYGEEKHVHGELSAVLKAYLDAVLKAQGNKRLSTAWEAGFNGILDAYFGPLPETFTYEGKSYTPKSFAESLDLNPSDYISFTSYTHHPFYKAFPLEVADNWLWGYMHNVPMEEMKAVVDNALDNGYPVAWGADVSEGGFKWRKGYAVIPVEKGEKDLTGTELSRWVKLSDQDRADKRYDINGPVEEITVTQEMRQDMFDRKETTDDHGMVIVGKAVDQKGNKYYKVQNSWDTNQVYDGYIYVSEPYFLAKTLDIMVNKAAVPAEISKKLK
ncbi:C1 family peptidase [uncultured Muribaculum sp.]|uniref:aminopeptidase C n=1 Tax=uncultured Muribaculum sp. TaxID=1918613 RepID=UPI002591AAFD|nr:C1 family peptidase [uncultured Muribaculum sp.]